VHPFSDLCAGTYQGVRVDHRSFVDVGADISNAGATPGNLTLIANNDITLKANLDISGKTLNLNAGGKIDQQGGVITALELTGKSGGSTTLEQGNLVTTLQGFQAGSDFSFKNAQVLDVQGKDVSALSIDGVKTTAGDVRIETNGGLTFTNNKASVTAGGGNTVTLVAAGSITQDGNGGIITAGELTGKSNGTATLTADNLVDALQAFRSQNDFRFNNNTTLDIKGSDVSALGIVAEIRSSANDIAITTNGQRTRFPN
jgi:hypothetical protein